MLEPAGAALRSQVGVGRGGGAANPAECVCACVSLGGCIHVHRGLYRGAGYAMLQRLQRAEVSVDTTLLGAQEELEGAQEEEQEESDEQWQVGTLSPALSHYSHSHSHSCDPHSLPLVIHTHT